MKGFSRFERKILVAIAVVVSGSLFGSLVFGYVAVRDAYRMGVNAQVRRELEEGLEARRDHLVAVRELAERTTSAIARDARLRDALRADDAAATESFLDAVIAAYPEVASVELATMGESLAARERPRDAAVPVRPIHRTEEVPGVEPPVTVEVVLVEPESTFERFQQAGELAALYTRLESRRDFVSKVYLVVYMAFVLLITLAAMAIAALISRRVTRQVSALAEANRRLGAGDLDVHVAVRSDDEVGELTASFNTMVRDMRETRARVEYLQRIGAWQEFARRLAHEIKNPLTPIQLAAQEIVRTYQGEDRVYRRKLEDAASIIGEEVATLRRLVGEFSSFARLPVAELAAADLREFLVDFARSVPGLLETAVPDGSVPPKVTVHAPGEPLPVRIDAMMLKRCVDNLVRNAVQATSAVHPDGDGHVTVSATRERDRIVLAVEDDGPGIRPEDRARVFDPYFTTKSDGTGLGLPIVKKVALEHGGGVDLVPTREGGARFELWLPVAPEPASNER